MANSKTTSLKNSQEFRNKMLKVFGGRKRHIININGKLYMMSICHLQNQVSSWSKYQIGY